MADLKFPEELKYTSDHEWIRVEGNIGWIGITDFAQSELGEIVYIEVDTVGETLDSGEVFGIVEAVKTTSDLYMPIPGTVLEFNPAIDPENGDDPALINSSPYEGGWIVKIEITNMEDLKELLSADAYKAEISD